MIIAVPEPPSGDFLLLVQEKVTKEKDTPDGASGSCASRHWGPRRATGHSLSCGSGAVIPDRSPDGLTPMPCGARTAPYGTQLHPRQRLRQALAEGSRDAQTTHHRRSYLCHA